MSSVKKRRDDRVIWCWTFGSGYSPDSHATYDLRVVSRTLPSRCFEWVAKKKAKKGGVGNGRRIARTIVSWPVSFDTVLNPIRATSWSSLFFFRVLSGPLLRSSRTPFFPFRAVGFLSRQWSFPSVEQTTEPHEYTRNLETRVCSWRARSHAKTHTFKGVETSLRETHERALARVCIREAARGGWSRFPERNSIERTVRESLVKIRRPPFREE